MGVSHIALAVKDIEETHRFYTEAMGFDLVKVEIAHREFLLRSWQRPRMRFRSRPDEARGISPALGLGSPGELS